MVGSAGPELLSGHSRVTYRYRSAALGTWIVWLIVAAVLGAVEMVTLTIAFGLVAVGALVAAVAGAAGGNLAVQFGAFAVTSAVGLGLGRPLVMRHVRQPPVLRRGPAALVGRSALVTQEVSPAGGRVRIGADLWPARPYDETLVIPAGTWVEVMHIEEGTALVYPREQRPQQQPPAS
jgi:membrane protein implicated in regulation of membrane protease activity